MDFLSNKYMILAIIVLIVLIILVLVLTKPKKVKPITKTIDDVNDEKTEIEKVIEALEGSKESRPMTTFEEEQEANAIISYQELVQAVKEKRALMEAESKPKEIVKTIEPKPLEVTVEDIKEVEVTEKPKFKNSEFISPIFGKAKDNDEFLKELKDFRSNL